MPSYTPPLRDFRFVKQLFDDQIVFGTQLLQGVNKGRDGIATIGVVGSDRGDRLHVLPACHQARAGQTLNIGIRGHAEDVRVDVLRVSQDRAF